MLLDTSGVLKYADFGLSKVEGENLEELFLKFAEAGEHWNVQSAEEMMKQITTSSMKLASLLVYLLVHCMFLVVFFSFLVSPPATVDGTSGRLCVHCFLRFIQTCSHHCLDVLLH